METEEKIKLFSTHCSHCKALELMLKKKRINYEEVYIDPQKSEQVQIMLDMGLQTAPGLVVGGKVMNFTQAMAWVKEQ